MPEAEPDDGSASVAGLLRRHRVAAGLTQEQLAERAQLSVRGVRYLERGLRRPYPDTVRRLTVALGLSAQDRQELAAAARSGGPLPAQTPASRGDAPIPPGPLIGREQLVTALCGALSRRGTRLVTLTGPGGVGKTRVALEVAADVRTVFRGGVVWVPLASVTEPSGVPTALAQALGLTVTGGPVLPAVADAVRGRRVLLVVDNFEHLTDGAAVLARLLATCPQLAVLVTSRAALRISGEQEMPVPPLTPPEVDTRLSVYGLAANPAVDLFARRAQGVRPEFALTEANAAAVAGICRKLDGIPLALELAAARVRVLTPNAILARLEPRLAFLTGGAVDLPVRQRTMRETIAWSYQLLPATGRSLFRRMAVFRGGSDLAAVEALCGDAGDLAALLDALEHLQRSSLILVQESGEEEEPRLAMFQVVGEYAGERLQDSGEADQLRRRHADYYAAVAQDASGRFSSPSAGHWLHHLERDHDNLRAALCWYIETGHAEEGLRLAAALWWFWYVRGYAAEGRSQLAALLTLPYRSASPASTADRAQALLGEGQLAVTQGDYPAARQSLHQSIALYRQLDDQRGTAEALLSAGFLARVQERHASATALLERALTLSRSSGHAFIIAAALHHLGMIATDAEQDYPRAGHLLHESLALYETLHLPRFLGLLQLSLGDLALAEGDTVRARLLLLQALGTLTVAGEKLGLSGALDSLARLTADQHNPHRAVQLAAAAHQLRTTTGTRSWPVVHRRRKQWLTNITAILDPSEFQTAWTEGAALTIQQILADP